MKRRQSCAPGLLSDSGSSYIAGDLPEWLDKQKITHIRGAPIILKRRERSRHQTRKNRILLENYYARRS
jgi:putative transposase